MEESKAVEAKANSVQEFSTDLLRVYYGRLFPYDTLFDWLSYGNDPSKESAFSDKDYFSRREWSFTIEDDIYIRYQSFKDKSEMIASIQKRQPHKIDIGAVFTANPKDHTTIKPELFKTVERELVFDIDMTDYDDIRTCCSGAEICHRCWPYMTMALKVVDRTLREDFAFRHILWVYSGRRGVHCWVCDSEARALSNEARSAVVEYMSVQTGSAQNSDKRLKQSFTQIHPMMRKSYSILEPLFERYIADDKGQGLLAKKDRYMKVLNSLPHEQIRTDLYNAWEKNETLTGAERWRQLATAITPASDQQHSHAGIGGSKKRKIVNYAELDAWRYELVFTHCYPRLDANVSKAQNHLLKSPFCVHPKTGRVCVPINPKQAESFDPFVVPTVRSLCAEVDEYDKLNMAVDEPDATGALSSSPSATATAAATVKEGMSDIEKTSLHDAIRTFHSCFMKGLSQSIKKSNREKSDLISAANIDF